MFLLPSVRKEANIGNLGKQEMAVEIASSVLVKIAEYLVFPIVRQFGYLFYYNRNIENLRSQVEKLKEKKHGVLEEVNMAHRNCENIRCDVTKWLKSVDENEACANRILEDKEKVGKGCCLNIKSRYLLSRKAVKKTQNLGKLLAEGKFERVACPPTPMGIIHTPPAVVETLVDVRFRGDGIQEASEAASVIDMAMPSTSKGGFVGFESRSWIMRDVMKVLKDDKVCIIGIWGMGGVGKTTMANEVVKRVKREGIFDEVGMVVVSREPDLRKVQGDIAEWLGLRLQEQSLFARAGRLHERLTQKGPSNKPKKILIILDDVWIRLDLEEVGIHYANDHHSCKILLTSRKKDVCEQMGTDRTYRIEVLAKEEAWNLFQETTIIPLGATNLFPVAEDIVNECGGLPIAITTIARVLANKSKPVWNLVLRQLRNSVLQVEYSVVYATFQVSYDYLQNAEIQIFFLLCCLFPDDFDIPIEDLVRYGVGLKIFRYTKKLHEARENAHAYTEMLRNSNLLLGSAIVDCVKMHDLVRDFALSIASEGKFLVRFGNEIKEWPSEDTYEHYTSISLQCDKMDELPDGLECPNLKLLQLAGFDHELLKFPERFFEGMRKLQVLVLRRVSIPSLPESLQFLTNLRTLSLNCCRLEGDVSMIGKLEVLEILSFAYSEIQDLPIEIGKLSRLRLLDLTGCIKLHRIAPALLSSLIHLEELYLRGTSICWAEEIQANPSIHGDGGGEMNASFTELMLLSNVVVLEIDIPYEVLPVDLIFLEKLEKFYVCVGGTYEKEIKYVLQNTLCCIVDTSVILEGVLHLLCRKTEVLYLKVTDLKNLQKEFERGELLNLRDLELKSCHGMVSLVNNVGRQTTNVFHNLESLCLSDMSKLKSIFSLSIASGLINLRTLKVVRCQAMEELFTKERGYEDKEAAKAFVILRLESLYLDDLPSLVGFCKAVDEIELPQLEVIDLCHLPKITSIYSKTENLAAECQNAYPFFNKKVKLNNMARLQLEGMENLTEIWLAHNLQELIVKNCGRLVNIFSSAIGRGLVMLEHLDIRLCEMMDAIFWMERGEDEAAATAVAKIQFPHLKDLHLERLPNLVHFCKSFEEVEFPQLEKVNLQYLPKLDGLASKGHLFNTKLQNLRRLDVQYCDSVEGGHELAAPTQLQSIELLGLDNLRHVWKKGLHVIQGSFQNLSFLSIGGCGSLRHAFTPPMAKVLVGLQTVSIYSCTNLEAIVAKEEEEEDDCIVGGGGIILFPQLTYLYLCNLSKLLNMTPKPYTFNWSSLKDLILIDCGTLIETLNDTLQVTSNNMETQLVRELHNLTVSFPLSLLLRLQNLQQLVIWSCNSLEVVFDLQGFNINDEGHLAPLTQLTRIFLKVIPKLRHVWKTGPHVIQLAGAFQCLSSLSVEECDSLRHVFTPSIAKLLSRLQTLKIHNCANLEAIVAEEEEEEEDIVEGGGIFILFPQLTILSLEKLPKFLNVTPMAYTFNWPSLKDLTLVDCGKLIETLYNTLQVALVDMETLKVHRLDNVTVFFPTSVLPQLEHLEQLDIESCSSLEVVFDLQGLNANNEGRYELLASVLTQLTDIDLYSLPKLRHIWKTGVHVIQGSFKNLSSLHLEHCDSLKHVFTPSMAKLLLELEEVEIVECENLEAIVAEDDREEYRLELGRGGGITVNLFPQLTSLHLQGLRNLLTITPKPYTFNKSSLEVIDCDKLQDIQ
ncbi:hypothetical protein LguiB_004159 [Lonicera macranthoides]